MLKLYGNRLSVNVRRVWVTLLEKQLAFEPILLQLDGDQFQSEFTAINPLQRVPVLEDDDFRVVESLAILDYLELQYPSPPLLPVDARAIATVRMAELIAINELQPATLPLTRQALGMDVLETAIAQAHGRITIVLQMYESMLRSSPYLAGSGLTLADIVAGTLVPSLPMFGLSFDAYPRLQAWVNRLEERDSWQQTTPDPAEIEAAMPHIRRILERRV